MRWTGWTNFVLGIWLFFAPLTLGYASTGAAVEEDVTLGLVITALALVLARGPENRWMTLVGWVVAVAGLWVVIAPYMLGYTATMPAVVNDVIVGLAVFTLAVWRALLHGDGEMPHMMPHA